jgi:hypothetical protein
MKDNKELIERAEKHLISYKGVSVYNASNELIRDLLAAIQGQGWVKTSERTPKQYDSVTRISVPIVFLTEEDEGVFLRLGYYDYARVTYFESGVKNGGWLSKVTMFHELPTPPQAEVI